MEGGGEWGGTAGGGFHRYTCWVRVDESHFCCSRESAELFECHAQIVNNASTYAVAYADDVAADDGDILAAAGTAMPCEWEFTHLGKTYFSRGDVNIYGRFWGRSQAVGQSSCLVCAVASARNPSPCGAYPWKSEKLRGDLGVRGATGADAACD